MGPMRYHATRSLAVMALTAIPALALAQAAAQPNPAAEHLAAARASLNKVLNAPVPAGDMFKKVADLKTEYLQLERAASTASPEWFAHYAMIDRLIGELLGPSSSTESGAVGTSGRAGSPAGHLDAAAAANLQEFRTHLMAFSAAMSAVTPGAAPAAPAASAAPPPAAAAAVPAPVAPPAPSAAAAAEPDTTALVDQTTALVDSALSAGAPGSDTVSVDRAMLEQIKKQLERIKQRISTP
jgi:hypothetical protein